METIEPHRDDLGRVMWELPAARGECDHLQTALLSPMFSTIYEASLMVINPKYGGWAPFILTLAGPMDTYCFGPCVCSGTSTF
jgi:hypothetical protein